MSIFLGGYPAKQCARMVHNKFSPSAPDEPAPADDLQAIFDEGRVFEAQVIDELRSVFARANDLLVVVGANWDSEIDCTMRAIEERVPVIVNGRLPNADGRSGAPDLLVRWSDGYLPVDIKNHQTLSKPSSGKRPSRARALVSPLGTPSQRIEHIGRSNRGSRWRDDVMQLAHYTRMLQSLGLHPSADDVANPDTLIGGIIGTSSFVELSGQPFGITWYDLTTSDQKTYSASASGHRQTRSALERYDHEFTFRQKVAEVASVGGELVRPFGTSECRECAWTEYCKSVVPEDDASFSITAGQLNVREWQLLYPADGELSIRALAQIDPSAIADEFLRESAGTQSPIKRLENAVRRARMTVEGREIEPLEGIWPQVPSADIEIDYDIEWDRDGRIYQWGLRIRENQDDSTARYEPVVSFDELDDASEAELARRFADKIEELSAEAAQRGLSLQIYHWHHVELSRTRKFDQVAEVLHDKTLDLLTWFNAGFFSRQGSSIKAVAPAVGFTWSVDDPGGRISQDKIDAARTSNPEAVAARQWCLDYNKSDVAAQAAIRDGIRRLMPSI